MKKYNIDNLHQDVNSIYSNYDRGNTDEEITIKIALNICKTFIKDNQDIPIDRPGSIKNDPLFELICMNDVFLTAAEKLICNELSVRENIR